MFIFASGKVNNFCSGKCQKNMLKLKRKPLAVRWTTAYREEHKKGQSSLKPEGTKTITSKEGKKGTDYEKSICS